MNLDVAIVVDRLEVEDAASVEEQENKVKGERGRRREGRLILLRITYLSCGGRITPTF
jgi:hypothetical protein